jgi:predicted acylesterase/phospholipase RssA
LADTTRKNSSNVGFAMISKRLIVLGAFVSLALGCRSPFSDPSPVSVGMNTRDIYDVQAQREANEMLEKGALYKAAYQAGQERQEKLAQQNPERAKKPHNVLCLSGGGSYGAYTAGVLNGWTQSGTRPTFDVVTGISTGALIAPFAFLGPQYDDEIRRLYTESSSRDLYILRPIRGLFREAFADNSPLAKQLDKIVTPEMMAEIAAAHQQGRRLYIGTTELEGRRFVIWDIGAIATRGTEEDLKLIKLVLLGSSAIPGFFPPSKIPVNVDGQQLVERHGDGGTSQAIFFRPPHQPTASRDETTQANRVVGTNVWCIVAGKLYADPTVIKPISFQFAGQSASTVIYAQTRGDLQRIFTLSLLAGMNYRLTAIPDKFDAPKSSADFNPEPMGRMYAEGVRVALSPEAWRKTPPGLENGEAPLERAGTNLNLIPQP